MSLECCHMLVRAMSSKAVCQHVMCICRATPTYLPGKVKRRTLQQTTKTPQVGLFTASGMSMGIGRPTLLAPILQLPLQWVLLNPCKGKFFFSGRSTRVHLKGNCRLDKQTSKADIDYNPQKSPKKVLNLADPDVLYRQFLFRQVKSLDQLNEEITLEVRNTLLICSIPSLYLWNETLFFNF